jgi:hypothetical protein
VARQLADGIEQDFRLCLAEPRCRREGAEDTDDAHSGAPSHLDVFRCVADVYALLWREAKAL